MSKKREIFKLPESYKLAYSEEFDKELDKDLWMMPNCSRKGGYWSEDQISIKNNQLVIRTEYKDGEKPGYYTGDLHWEHKRVTYGYFEARCKVDNIRGAWSAFWLMPDDITNCNQKAQDGCEIDIFENAIPYLLQTTLHYDAYKGQRLKYTFAKDYYTGFHTYGLDWKKDSIKFYYDNKLVWHVTNPNLISHYPTRLEISTEINGHSNNVIAKPDLWFWFGNGIITSKRNKGKLPYDYIVDYVRIYDNGQLEWSEGNDPTVYE